MIPSHRLIKRITEFLVALVVATLAIIAWLLTHDGS